MEIEERETILGAGGGWRSYEKWGEGRYRIKYVKKYVNKYRYTSLNGFILKNKCPLGR